MWQRKNDGRTAVMVMYIVIYTQTKKEQKKIEKLLGSEIEIAKHIEYDPGAYR